MKKNFILVCTLFFTLPIVAQVRDIVIDCPPSQVQVEVKKCEKIKIKIGSGCCSNPDIKVLNDQNQTISNSETITIPSGTKFLTVKIKCAGADEINMVLQAKEGICGSIVEKHQPVVDAMLFENLWSRQDLSTAKKLLESYGVVEADFKDIEYLKSYEEIWKAEDVVPQNGNLNLPNSQANSVSDVLPDATEAIDALAKFAVKRFKEELMIAYLDSLKLTLTSSKEMRILLPSIHRVVQEQDFFNYPVFLQSLRESGANDINDFPFNMKEYIKDKKNIITNNDAMVYPILMSSCDLVESLRKYLPAAETIERLSIEDYIIDGTDAYSNIVRGFGAFSRTLHAEESSRTASGWAKTDNISYILTHKHAFNFWMILLLKLEKENLKNVTIGSQNLYDYLNQDISKKKSVANDVKELLYQVNVVSSIAKKWADAEDSSKFMLHSEFIVSMTDLLGAGVEIFRKDTNNLRNATNIDKYLKIIRTVGKLESSIRQKEYGVAISNVVELVSRIEILDGSKSPAWAKHFSEYANFLATLIKAEDGDELEAVLENAALPVQSYRLKRKKGAFNMTINMYPGAAIGSEFFVEEVKDDNEIKGGFLIAPTVPVGVGFNWGVCNGHSFSVFFPIIDIGAVAALRIQNNVSKLPELKWDNVLSPGFQLQWGMKNSPLAIGIGGQFGPALRKVTPDPKNPTAIIKDKNFRVALTMTVDVPVFSFF